MYKRISLHGNCNHIGEAINLVEILKVEKVIFNSESYNELEKELIKIYRTDQDGSVMFKIKNRKLRIEACSP